MGIKTLSHAVPLAKVLLAGGISGENYRKYLAMKNVACVDGSWVVPPYAIRHEQWEKITALAAETLREAR